MKKLLLVTALAIVGALTGCGDATFPYVTSLQVSPTPGPSVAAGQTQQFTAQGTFSNGQTQDVTSLVTWSSSDLSVASISQGAVASQAAPGGGLVTTYTPGTPNITATLSTPRGAVTGMSTLTVAAPDLISIVVTDSSAVVPGPNSVTTAQIAKGTSHQFFAYGIYTDGGERLLPLTSVTWSSTPLTAATINNVGLATGISSVGSPATITATANNLESTAVSGTADLAVTNATLSSVVVSPDDQTIAPLTRLQFMATGLFSDGTTQDITNDANWTSSDNTKATVSNSAPTNGLVTAIAASPSLTISAALGAPTGTAPLVVSSASLTSIALTPATSGVAIGSTLQMQAVGTFSDASTQPINLATAWSVTPSNGSIATVGPTGLVTSVAAGTATVLAKFGAVSQTATLNIQNLTSIAITAPTTATIAQGTQTQFVATATLADTTTQDISSSVTWVSTAPTIATISLVSGSAGWASGIAQGTTTIAAVLDDTIATPPTQLTVSNATLTSIAITSPADSIVLGATEQYTATGTFSDASTQDLSNQVAWSSTNPAAAVINGYGLAVSTGAGTTTVKAAADGVTATDPQNLTVQ